MIPQIEFLSTPPAPLPEDKTFMINLEENRIEGHISGMKAIEQTIVMMLSTERYASLALSWDYGAGIERYLGKPYDYVVGDIGREIKETLLTDDRITDVHSFEYEHAGDELKIKFVAETVFGNSAMNLSINT